MLLRGGMTGAGFGSFFWGVRHEDVFLMYLYFAFCGIMSIA
jgi:hypothetical protein